MSRFDVRDVLVALCEAGEIDLALRIARALATPPPEPVPAPAEQRDRRSG
jgi:hypothetical protein